MTPQPGIPDHELDDPQSPVEDHSIEVGLGHRVRALRTSRGMSVAALSERREAMDADEETTIKDADGDVILRDAVGEAEAQDAAGDGRGNAAVDHPS